MRICKFCGKSIDEGQVWNPDNEGNGYHHHCLIDMEFKARDSRIYNKGKKDVLDKMMAEINEYDSLWVEVENRLEQAKQQVLEIIDKYKEG